VHLELFADYFQFYLQDDDISLGNLGNAWGHDAVERLRIAVVPNTIGVGTARNDTVPVDIEVFEERPPIELEAWEHVVEADLEVQTGRIVVAGCTDYFADAARLTVPPGLYRARVLYGDRQAATDTLGDMLRYRVELWPTSSPSAVSVAKQGPMPWSG
jgi:hypothetical protein